YRRHPRGPAPRASASHPGATAHRETTGRHNAEAGAPADPEAAVWPPPALLRASARAGPGPAHARQTRRAAGPAAGHRPAPAAAVRPAPGPAPVRACPAAAAVRHGGVLV